MAPRAPAHKAARQRKRVAVVVYICMHVLFLQSYQGEKEKNNTRSRRIKKHQLLGLGEGNGNE
jgi:uncharacterized membrane protein YsdA (DUF1294 family)